MFDTFKNPLINKKGLGEVLKYVFIIFISICFYLPSPASAETLDLKTFSGPDFTILYEEPLKNAVPDVAKIYPRIKYDLEEKLGMKVGFKPSIILIHTDSEFRRMVRGNDLITAFALAGKKQMVINYSKMLNTPLDLELTLQHELSHLLLHDYIERKNLPKWLDEGVSQWVSNGIADIIQFDGKKLLKRTVLSGRYIPLHDISRRFPREPELFKLSYEESRSFIEYLEDRFGTEKVLSVLEALHNGDFIEDALIDNMGSDIYTLEKDWHQYLRRRYTWFIYFSNNLYWLIFAFGAVIVFLGYVKLRIRMKTHFKDEDDDDYDDDIYKGEPEEMKPWEK